MVSAAGLQQASAQGLCNCLRDTVDLEFAIDGGDVPTHGSQTDAENVGGLLVGEPLDESPEHLLLAVGEVESGRRWFGARAHARGETSHHVEHASCDAARQG